MNFLIDAQLPPANAELTRWFQPLFPQVLGYLQQGEYLIELY